MDGHTNGDGQHENSIPHHKSLRAGGVGGAGWACSLPHNILAIANSFITVNKFSEVF